MDELREVFVQHDVGDVLPADKAFRDLLVRHMESLVARGAAATVAAAAA